MKTSEFDFQFPQELIAHEPAALRDHSRLMVLNRADQSIQHKQFFDIVDYLQLGDLLVLNDTKVMPANLLGRKEDGGAKVEVFLVKLMEPATDSRGSIWMCLVKPGKKLRIGSRIILGDGEVTGIVLEKRENGEQIIEFTGDLAGFMQQHGELPLPPYIKNPKSEILNSKQILNSKSQLSKRYQTVYAKKLGAAAAPTAGLHFTPELLKKIKQKGIDVAYLTLHTGLGTFQPVRTDEIEKHPIHSESFYIPEETVKAVRQARRVVAAGTTVMRALETQNSKFKTQKFKDTNLFIYPGYQFKVVDAMITNFHWPKTTLLALVSAFAGCDFIMKAYEEAIKEKYRFFSFGDAMLIL
ncbi:tRNA preQ1(34) S-adenosylmethionine ribosyltransferase-isomerase QueA [Candidatus Saganbacteria bacterium]|nr:tRNA preQ1(34) S-adenosylmethionine ribosyltransferase-isomerase QueA [Candidatus Saganbacteria bacterium]